MGIHYKTAEELEIMREAGRIVARTHEALREALQPGVSTWELDQVARQLYDKHGAKSAFLNYPHSKNGPPFPAAITVSINNELVHGIPSQQRIIHEGDIVSIDTGAIYKGYIGDAAFTAGVGHISPEAQQLLTDTEAALYAGIEMCQMGNKTSDISLTIQQFAEARGYGVVRDYTGHGVGRRMHEEPQVPNWWPTKRQRIRGMRSVPLKTGMVLALEPMISLGAPETNTLDDEWTVVMADGKLCAHFEHTVAITDNGPWILTQL